MNQKQEMKIAEVPESSTILIDAVDYCLTNFPSQMTFYDKTKKRNIALQWKNHFAAFSVEQLYKSIDTGAATWEKMPSVAEMLTSLKIVRSEAQEDEVPCFKEKSGFITLKDYLKSIGVKDTRRIKGIFDKEAKNVKIPDFLSSVCDALDIVNIYKATKYIKSLSKFKGISDNLLKLLVEQKQLDILAEMHFSEGCSSGQCRGFHIDFSFANGLWYTSTRPCGRSK